MKTERDSCRSVAWEHKKKNIAPRISQVRERERERESARERESESERERERDRERAACSAARAHTCYNFKRKKNNKKKKDLLTPPLFHLFVTIVFVCGGLGWWVGGRVGGHVSIYIMCVFTHTHIQTHTHTLGNVLIYI